MDFKKHMIMKFNYITRIKELEDDNLYLANENMKLKKNIKNLKVEKEELKDDIIQLQSTKPVFQKEDLDKNRPKTQYHEEKHEIDLLKPAHTYNVKKSTTSKSLISKDKKKVSRVNISIQNLVRAMEVKAQKFNLKKQSLESTPLVNPLVNTHNEINSVPEPIPIPIPIQKTIMCDNDNDNDNDNEKNDKVIFIDSDSDCDCDLVNEFSFTSSLSKI